jgi:uncharacterized membrane protein
VPSLAVFFGVVLAVSGIAILIFFIHHIATAIQASSIIESVSKETLISIDRQYSRQGAGQESQDRKATGRLAPATQDGGRRVVSTRIGYIQSIDVAALVRIAHKNGAVVHIGRGVGDFVVRGAALASIYSPGALPEECVGDIEAAFNIYRFRTIEQDVGFGIRQIVDIALRALSPSVNDTTTGVMCVDYLSAILAHLAGCAFPARERCCEGELRVVTTGQTFESLLSDAFDQIRSSARGNFAVLVRLLEAIRAVSDVTTDEARRRVLLAYVSCMQESRDGLSSAQERAQYEEILVSTRLALAR